MPISLASLSVKAPLGAAAAGRPGSCRATKAPLLPPARPGMDESSQTRATASRLPAGCAEIPPTQCPGTSFSVSVFQHMGDRKTQEDRFIVVPKLDPESPVQCAFFGVFDGTVGDFASENVKDLVVPQLVASANWQAARKAAAAGRPAEEQDNLLENAFRDMYRQADDALLARCAKYTQHYATCTSVTLLVVGDTLVFGHLGDSRIIVAKEDESGNRGQLIGEQMTEDHKPDLENERRRIEQCGGMVERLQNHSNKPFIRGGDFMMRKALGEQPMQLQYSRAFGAKDLKIFGLSNVPDVKIIRMGASPYRHVRFIILASDGLWDVLSSQQAAMIAQHAVEDGQSPAETLVRHALHEQARVKARADNITAVCIQFN
ncbi:unnamed protein product [Polarella glacialis]|uniref:PPM-type phosphatase domain-containing protein n=1 Tax=Polarella glacialis TaxID=89957 RepID=A0A813G9Q1_POLGL|nr:unnamed protein product [Polarella glacialis]|mmetsp:Transcript_86543/g.155879  ORF Transcript_86543/g.155879 Transcript_86543/m.155879 type:complete len:375 (+) Transcript_86543:115-1239(+)